MFVLATLAGLSAPASAAHAVVEASASAPAPLECMRVATSGSVDGLLCGATGSMSSASASADVLYATQAAGLEWTLTDANGEAAGSVWLAKCGTADVAPGTLTSSTAMVALVDLLSLVKTVPVQAKHDDQTARLTYFTASFTP